MSEATVMIASGVAGDRKPSRSARYKDVVKSLGHKACTLACALKHPRVPWLAKFAATCATAYLISPVQLIPSFIPVIGQLDDVAVLYLGMKAVRKLTPPEIFAECEARGEAAFSAARRSLSFLTVCDSKNSVCNGRRDQQPDALFSRSENTN